MKTYLVRVDNYERRSYDIRPICMLLELYAESEEDAEAQAHTYMHSINWDNCINKADVDWGVSEISEIKVKGEQA